MLTIIGCGNLSRKDDGVGIVVAQQLQAYFREQPNAQVQVYDAGTGGIDVMFQARHASSLLLIDACVSGSVPGTIFKVPGHELANCPIPSYSMHNFRWDHALYAGRQIFGDSFPKDVTVYLIEASDTSFGLELSFAVRQAAETVCDYIRDEVKQLIPLHESTSQLS